MNSETVTETVTETFQRAAHAVADYADDVAAGRTTSAEADETELLVITMQRLLLDMRQPPPDA